MRIAVLDTHALVWFLQKDSHLSKEALRLILRHDVTKLVPFIVVCEVHYLHARGRFAISAQDVTNRIRETDDFEIAPHTEDHIPHLLSQLGIHDALILATGLVRHEKNRDVVILSRGEQIKRHSPLPVVWED